MIKEMKEKGAGKAGGSVQYRLCGGDANRGVPRKAETMPMKNGHLTAATCPGLQLQDVRCRSVCGFARGARISLVNAVSVSRGAKTRRLQVWRTSLTLAAWSLVPSPRRVYSPSAPVNDRKIKIYHNGLVKLLPTCMWKLALQ